MREFPAKRVTATATDTPSKFSEDHRTGHPLIRTASFEASQAVSFDFSLGVQVFAPALILSVIVGREGFTTEGHRGTQRKDPFRFLSETARFGAARFGQGHGVRRPRYDPAFGKPRAPHPANLLSNSLSIRED